MRTRTPSKTDDRQPMPQMARTGNANRQKGVEKRTERIAGRITPTAAATLALFGESPADAIEARALYLRTHCHNCKQKLERDDMIGYTTLCNTCEKMPGAREVDGQPPRA